MFGMLLEAVTSTQLVRRCRSSSGIWKERHGVSHSRFDMSVKILREVIRQGCTKSPVFVDELLFMALKTLSMLSGWKQRVDDASVSEQRNDRFEYCLGIRVSILFVNMFLKRIT
jgi:hypothetical protein